MTNVFVFPEICLISWDPTSVSREEKCHSRKDKYLLDKMNQRYREVNVWLLYTNYISKLPNNIKNDCKGFDKSMSNWELVPLCWVHKITRLQDSDLATSEITHWNLLHPTTHWAVLPSGWLAIQRVASSSSIHHQPHLQSALMIHWRPGAAAGQQCFFHRMLMGSTPLFYQLTHEYLWLHVGESIQWVTSTRLSDKILFSMIGSRNVNTRLKESVRCLCRKNSMISCIAAANWIELCMKPNREMIMFNCNLKLK